jgi:hypothetical protein
MTGPSKTDRAELRPAAKTKSGTVAPPPPPQGAGREISTDATDRPAHPARSRSRTRTHEAEGRCKAHAPGQQRGAPPPPWWSGRGRGPGPGPGPPAARGAAARSPAASAATTSCPRPREPESGRAPDRAPDRPRLAGGVLAETLAASPAHSHWRAGAGEGARARASGEMENSFFPAFREPECGCGGAAPALVRAFFTSSSRGPRTVLMCL